MTNQPNGTLYIGITNNLVRRVYEHKEGLIDSFATKHKLTSLAYFEVYDEAYPAIYREKTLKRWLRQWKIDLIQRDNPKWQDLYDDL